MPKRQRCKMCGQQALGSAVNDELGYCDDCRGDFVESFVNALTKPLYVWRMARGLSYSGPSAPSRSLLKSARTRQKNVEREIVRLIASMV